ncbi:MAG: serine/threonine protein kinase [Acidiferrobacterales bacterium]
MSTYHHALAPGARIESYEVKRVLGVGGFGVTYRAYDHVLERDVAMKEYLPTGLAVRTPDGTTVSPKSDNDVQNYEYGLKRFLDEARTLAKFREPNIVRVIRYMEAHGTAYFVMDYEEGHALSARLKRRGTIPEDEVRAIILPILRSLRAVHSQKFLHRDIKPANIYLRNDGSPVLLDFGSARLALGEQSRAMTGLVTPGYAPFEQYFSRGKQGPWTDLYGIGATMYHCITGLAPAASTERIAAIQDGEPDPLGNLGRLTAKGCSGGFVQTLMWMLEPNAKERPQTVDDVLDALDRDRAEPADTLAGGADTTRKTAFPETLAIDTLADTDTTWEPEILQTVEINLERHIGPLSKALVRKAAQKTSNVEELTELLSRFIPSDREKTVFLAKTQLIRDTETAPSEPPDSIAQPTAPPPEPTRAPPATGLHEKTLQVAEDNLAVYLGPMAKILVKKAASKTSDLDEFCRILAEELPDEEQKSAFRNAVRKNAPSGHG